MELPLEAFIQESSKFESSAACYMFSFCLFYLSEYVPSWRLSFVFVSVNASVSMCLSPYKTVSVPKKTFCSVFILYKSSIKTSHGEGKRYFKKNLQKSYLYSNQYCKHQYLSSDIQMLFLTFMVDIHSRRLLWRSVLSVFSQGWTFIVLGQKHGSKSFKTTALH